MDPLCRPVEAVLEVEAAAAPVPAPAPAEPGQYEEAQLLKDEVLIDDVGKPLNVVPSARGADESARGHLITMPSLCQQVRHPRHGIPSISVCCPILYFNRQWYILLL